jgi:hypothetical protein
MRGSGVHVQLQGSTQAWGAGWQAAGCAVPGCAGGRMVLQHANSLAICREIVTDWLYLLACRGSLVLQHQMPLAADVSCAAPWFGF